MGEWVELPAIGPDHVKSSRGSKHIMTGNLNHQVTTYPEFKGGKENKEKHYLKAQLVRLMHNCEIVPTGMYKTVDEKRRVSLTNSKRN